MTKVRFCFYTDLYKKIHTILVKSYILVLYYLHRILIDLVVFMFKPKLNSELSNLFVGFPSKDAVQTEVTLFKDLIGGLSEFENIAKSALSIVSSGLKQNLETATIAPASINWQLFPKASIAANSSKTTAKLRA